MQSFVVYGKDDLGVCALGHWQGEFMTQSDYERPTVGNSHVRLEQRMWRGEVGAFDKPDKVLESVEPTGAHAL